MFAERLELIKGRKLFYTASHLKFNKFHHNKRIAIKLQRSILKALAYVWSFSWVPDAILSRRKPLLSMKLAFPGMRFHLKCTHESLRAAFRLEIVLYFQSNPPLWTPQCLLLLVDNLTQPLHG